MWVTLSTPPPKRRPITAFSHDRAVGARGIGTAGCHLSQRAWRPDLAGSFRSAPLAASDRRSAPEPLEVSCGQATRGLLADARAALGCAL